MKLICKPLDMRTQTSPPCTPMMSTCASRPCWQQSSASPGSMSTSPATTVREFILDGSSQRKNSLCFQFSRLLVWSAGQVRTTTAITAARTCPILAPPASQRRPRSSSTRWARPCTGTQTPTLASTDTTGCPSSSRCQSKERIESDPESQ